MKITDSYCDTRELSSNTYRKQNKNLRKISILRKRGMRNILIHHSLIKNIFTDMSCVRELSHRKVLWVTLSIIPLLSITSGQQTSWVYQRHTPYTIQKDFQRFVASVGGDYGRFNFAGNFFSEDKGVVGSVFPKPIFAKDILKASGYKQSHSMKKDFHDIRIPKGIEKVLDLDIASRQFYEDIFDTSLPLSSPYRSQFSSTHALPGGSGTLASFEYDQSDYPILKTPNAHSKPFQQFSPNFKNSVADLKHGSIQGFATQKLGSFANNLGKVLNPYRRGLEVSWLRNRNLGPLSKETTEDRSLDSRAGLLFRNPMRSSRHKPLKHKTVQSITRQINRLKSSGNLDKFLFKNSVPHEQATFNYSNSQSHISSQSHPGQLSVPPGLHQGGPRSKHHGFSPAPHRNALQSLVHDSLRFPAPVGVDSYDDVQPVIGISSSGSIGCISSEDGKHRAAGAVWYGSGCRRHTCVHFKERHFVETDSCATAVHNPSYRCVNLTDGKQLYPDCCPKYRCNEDSLGYP